LRARSTDGAPTAAQPLPNRSLTARYVEVGSMLKNPSLPVWVVCSESHFTVLFAQDARCLQNAMPFDLQYYDELANQVGKATNVG
jgi:hypothetical protein